MCCVKNDRRLKLDGFVKTINNFWQTIKNSFVANITSARTTGLDVVFFTFLYLLVHIHKRQNARTL